MDRNTKTLIGAIVAAALAIAVYYGLIGQQQANTVQNQANQTLGTGPANPQNPATAQNPTPPSAAPTAPVSQSPAPSTRQ